MDSQVIDNEIISTAAPPEVIPHDDDTYGGDSSPVSLDYFRDKVREFQDALNSADQVYRAGIEVYAVAPSDTLADLLADYETRAMTLKATAETLNAGAALVNAVGGRMPVLSIPGTLGLPQFVMPAIYIAALATGAYLISWAKDYAQVMRAEIDERTRQLDAQTTDADRARVAAAQASAASASGSLITSGLGALSSVVKWGGIALLAFLAWKAYKSTRDDD